MGRITVERMAIIDLGDIPEHTESLEHLTRIKGNTRNMSIEEAREAFPDSIEAPEAPADLKELARQAAILKNEVAELDRVSKSKKEKLGDLCETILKTLQLMELENFLAHGYLFYQNTESSVQTPKTTEQKKALFDFLNEKGIFLEMASVHSQTLNSLYKNLAKEEAIKGNYDYDMPGVGKATPYTSLKLRKR